MNHELISDQDLVMRLGNRDTEAFELLYGRYAAVVTGLSFKILGDRAAAEEIMQEVFWRLWERADAYSSEQGNFGSWLLRIARNLSIDTWRRERRTNLLPESEALQQAILRYSVDEQPQVAAVEAAEAASYHAQVRAAVAALPQEQREVIQHAFYNGLTRREIATQQNLPVGTVHTRARLALQKLRETLQASGIHES